MRHLEAMFSWPADIETGRSDARAALEGAVGDPAAAEKAAQAQLAVAERSEREVQRSCDCFAETAAGACLLQMRLEQTLQHLAE